jgi:electron transfer flavoprotein alpha subunit
LEKASVVVAVGLGLVMGQGQGQGLGTGQELVTGQGQVTSLAQGMDIGGSAQIQRAEKLAKKLGGLLGGTRAVVDLGLLPPAKQIGLSGRNVNPNLLICLGLSGSLQFLAGVAGAKKIIAVNHDPDAPIFNVADVSLVMDLENLWPELDNLLGSLS